MRFVAFYNEKILVRAPTFSQCYSFAIMYGNGIFERIMIVDTSTAEIMCYIIAEHVASSASQ